MIRTRGAVAQMDDTRKPGTFSQGTVTVEKQQQHVASIQIGIYKYLITIKKAKITSKNYSSHFHTDRFLFEMFHNYAFKECISVEKLKL